MAQNKNVLASKTIWGVIIAAAGTITDSADLLSGLIGVEWSDKLVIAAGLLLAFYGRLKANTNLTLALALCVLVIAAGGCGSAGAQARDSVLSPWAVGAWPKVEALAQRGIDDMVDDGELTDASAASPRETVRLFGEAVGELGGGS